MTPPVVSLATTIVVVSAMVSIPVAEGSVPVTLVVVTLDIICQEAFNNEMTFYLFIKTLISQKLS